jgi:hypothetical protein
MQTDLVVNGQRVIRLHDQIPRIGMDLVSGDAGGQALRRQFGLVDNRGTLDRQDRYYGELVGPQAWGARSY